MKSYPRRAPEGDVLVTSPGTESSYPRPPQSLEHSRPPPPWTFYEYSEGHSIASSFKKELRFEVSDATDLRELRC